MGNLDTLSHKLEDNKPLTSTAPAELCTLSSCIVAVEFLLRSVVLGEHGLAVQFDVDGELHRSSYKNVDGELHRSSYKK